jgi:hypothetical protein
VTPVGRVECWRLRVRLRQPGSREASGNRPSQLRGTALQWFNGGTKAGGSLPDQRSANALSVSGSHGPEAQNRRGGASEGVRAALKARAVPPRLRSLRDYGGFESAEARSAKAERRGDKVLRLPAVRLPSPCARTFPRTPRGCIGAPAQHIMANCRYNVG